MIDLSAPSANLNQNHRATSPPLQEDEKEFTLVAEEMQTRKLSEEMSTEYHVHEDVIHEDQAAMNLGTSEGFFETPDRTVNVSSEQQVHGLFSSPAMKASLTISTVVAGSKRGFEEMSLDKPDMGIDWDPRSPEVIELDELDGLLDNY